MNLKLVHFFSVESILSFGASLIILSGGVLLYFHMMGILTMWSLLFPALMYFTSLPFCVSNGASKAMGAVKEHFGSATALLTTFQFLAGSLGSFICSLTSNDTVLPLALCFIFVGIVSLVAPQLTIRSKS